MRNTDNKHQCLKCDKPFKPDKRNLKRGWGLFCSKSCSISWRNGHKKYEERDRAIIELENDIIYNPHNYI